MKKPTIQTVAAATALVVLAGCAVTEEKIEMWKGTKNGPKKLAAASVNKDVPMEIRAEAVIALSEISDRDDENIWDLYIKSLEAMDKMDAAKIVEIAAPILSKKVDTEIKGGVSKSQVAAKDALFVMFDFASGPGKEAVQQALIKWCTKDYNIRALAGKYNIRSIIKKLGAPGAEALIPLLSPSEPTIQHVAELIREVGDKAVLKKASTALSAQIEKNISQLQEVHLIAAAVIGGNAIGSLLLKTAGNTELSAELQRYALRAYSEGLTKQSIKPDKAQAAALIAIAENAKQDRNQREEAYYVIAQTGDKSAVPGIRKLLQQKDEYFRAVALRSLLRLDGENLLAEALEDLERSKRVSTEEEVDGIVERVAAFPPLLPKVRGLLGSESAFIAGIAVLVLADMGVKNDKELLASLEKDERNLPKGFKHKKLQDAVKAAMESIAQRG